MPRIVTLLTDFGIASTYPAQMKGVILGMCPEAAVVDISHEVPRHDVRTAGFMLASAVGAFPEGTVHVAVIDPQVGSPRPILAARVDGSTYVAPDNGLLTVILHGRKLGEDGAGGARLVRVENRDIFRTEVSSTFHGRDIFAPVGAALARGMPLDDLGPAAPVHETVPMREPVREGDQLVGEVLYVDPFGNLITNLHRDVLEGLDLAAVEVHIHGAVIRGLCCAYSDVTPGSLLAYIGSAGYLELAVNRQSAAVRLGAEAGAEVRLTIPSAGPDA